MEDILTEVKDTNAATKAFKRYIVNRVLRCGTCCTAYAASPCPCCTQHCLQSHAVRRSHAGEGGLQQQFWSTHLQEVCLHALRSGAASGILLNIGACSTHAGALPALRRRPSRQQGQLA